MSKNVVDIVNYIRFLIRNEIKAKSRGLKQAIESKYNEVAN